VDAHGRLDQSDIMAYQIIVFDVLLQQSKASRIPLNRAQMQVIYTS
jgi:hypothetical protein